MAGKRIWERETKEKEDNGQGDTLLNDSNCQVGHIQSDKGKQQQ